MRDYHKLELKPKEIKNITNHLNKYYPELMQPVSNAQQGKKIYINWIGYFVKSNVDFLQKFYNEGSWATLWDVEEYNKNNEKKCLDIDISKIYLTGRYVSSMRPAPGRPQETDVYDDLCTKKYTSLIGIHDACSYLRVNQKAVFPRVLFGLDGIIDQVKIENKYLNLKYAKRFIKKLNKDNFLKGYINKYYQQYGEFKDHLQEEQSEIKEETLEK